MFIAISMNLLINVMAVLNCLNIAVTLIESFKAIMMSFQIPAEVIKRQLKLSFIDKHRYYFPGPGCSELTSSLGNVSLKFQMLISGICQYFSLKKCEKLLQCKSFSQFFNKKY